MSDTVVASGLSRQADVARQVLSVLRPLFERAVSQLAGVCAVGGKLDAARLDEHQVVSHELA
ncbi:MAG: acyl-CoA dehydrogenase, partial [Burkholderiales bacterium]